MKPFVFNKDSWHYSLATELGSFPKYQTDSNICEYTREVIKGGLLFGLVVALALGLLYWITITIVWWVVILQYGYFPENGPIVLSLVVGSVGSATAVAHGTPWAYRKVRAACYDERQSWESGGRIKTDNFLTHAYRSWKEKTCVRVTLIGDNEDN